MSASMKVNMWIATYIVLCLSVCVELQLVRVKTKKGTIIGQQSDGFNTFFGVPYAFVDEDNPFGKSVEALKFPKPFDASDPTIKCPQVIPVPAGDLQCLRLNIYVPEISRNNTMLPVLVWFHGGGFVKGSAGDYSGRYFMEHEIIVVTVNYRLGPYGFLCLNHPSVPGNQGLKDQVTALKWIKENIDAFGGDSDKITIAGQSYGGGAVDLHIYSLYDKYFDKAIIQSGSIFAEGFFTPPDHKAAIKIANYLGHSVGTTKKALKTLATISPIDVMEAAKNLSLKLTVCKEKRFNGVSNFIDKDPFHLYSQGRSSDTPILIGYNSKEDFGTFAKKSDDFFLNLGDIFYRKLERNFVMKESALKSISNTVKKFYLGEREIGSEAALDLSDFSSDFKINHPVERSVDKFIEQGKTVYKYLFSYIGGSIYKDIPGAGAIHTEELKYLFEMKTILNTLEQRIMTEKMTSMWARFVKHGKPTSDKSDLMVGSWVPVSMTDRPYLNIDVEMTLQNQLYAQRLAFWDLFWQTYSKRSIVYEGR